MHAGNVNFCVFSRSTDVEEADFLAAFLKAAELLRSDGFHFKGVLISPYSDGKAEVAYDFGNGLALSGGVTATNAEKGCPRVRLVDPAPFFTVCPLPRHSRSISFARKCPRE